MREGGSELLELEGEDRQIVLDRWNGEGVEVPEMWAGSGY